MDDTSEDVGKRMGQRVRCFVAMAFGKADADILFERSILATLEQLGVEAVRVDHLEHNRNINDVIVEQLRLADLAIADLTYARPSVYFEAGFAERQVPVVYTVRADHLRPAQERSDGDACAVHFDVSMRNIIAWQHADDGRFRTRLSARLQSVLRPILRARTVATEMVRAGREFAALSPEEQVSRLDSAANTELAKLGFSRSPPAGNTNLPRWDTFFEIHGATTKGRFSYGARLSGRLVRLVAVLSTQGLTTLELREHITRWNLSSIGLSAWRDPAPRDSFDIECTLVVCSAGVLSPKRIKKILFSARDDGSPEVLAWNLDDSSPTYRLALMGSVRTAEEAAERLRFFLGVTKADEPGTESP